MWPAHRIKWAMGTPASSLVDAENPVVGAAAFWVYAAAECAASVAVTEQ